MTEEQKAAKLAKENGILFPEKYRNGLRTAALLGITEFREKHPDSDLQQAVLALVATVNPKMPPLYLLEFTQHIIRHWMALEEKQAAAIAA